MSDEAPHNETKGESPKLPAVVAGLIVITGVAWYFWVKSDWNNAGTWGAIGDAVGPFTGLATALALGFAVYATMLQRKDLELQRDEMRAQREEMRLQREESAKAAQAQLALVQSLSELTKAQLEANGLAKESTKAQKANNMAVAAAALAQLEITVASSHAGGKQYEEAVKEATRNPLGVLRGIMFSDGDWRTRDDAPQVEKP